MKFTSRGPIKQRNKVNQRLEKSVSDWLVFKLESKIILIHQKVKGRLLMELI